MEEEYLGGIRIDNIERYIYLFQNGNTDFSINEWAEPIYAAMISAYQEDEGLTADIGNEYTRVMMACGYRSNKTYSPIERIVDRSGLEAIASHLKGVMIQNFSKLSLVDRKDLGDYLQYIFLELMNNVADHAHSPVGGYTMAQYYKGGERVQFVVADRGVGFLANMKLNYANITSEDDAIIEALKKGITSTRAKMYGAERNAGFGLYAMFEIMVMTGGKFIVISNDSFVRYSRDNVERGRLPFPWKGVVVAVELKEANINYDMDYFRRTYLWGEALGEDEDFFD